MIMELLRDRARRYPKSFDIPGRVILSCGFARAIDIEYGTLILNGNGYVVPDYMMEWVIGLEPTNGKPWTDCTHMYVPMIANSHCFAAEIVFADSTIYVYDSDHGCLTQDQLQRILEPMSVIIPMMARQANIQVNDRLAIQRNTTTARQGVS